MLYLKQSHLPEGWVVKNPLPIQVCWDERYYLVSDGILNQWGIGDTIEDANLDYGSTLVEIYEIYENGAISGNGFDAADLAKIRLYIERKPVTD